MFGTPGTWEFRAFTPHTFWPRFDFRSFDLWRLEKPRRQTEQRRVSVPRRGGSDARKGENNKSREHRRTRRRYGRANSTRGTPERKRRLNARKTERGRKGVYGNGRGTKRSEAEHDDGKTSPRTSEREKSFAQNSFWKTEARNCQRAKEIVEKFWLAVNGKRGADARLNRKRGAPCRLSETLLLSVKEIQNANFVRGVCLLHARASQRRWIKIDIFLLSSSLLLLL